MRRLTLLSVFLFAALNIGFAHAQAQLGGRMFFGPGASSPRDTCREGMENSTAKQSYGYCLGFLYAVMLQLQDSGKACTLGPADIGPIIKEALDALAEVKGSGLTPFALEILETRLVAKFPPC
jgi:hypothetical protein